MMNKENILIEIYIQTADVIDVLSLEKCYAMIREADFTAVDRRMDYAWRYTYLEDGNYSYRK